MIWVWLGQVNPQMSSARDMQVFLTGLCLVLLQYDRSQQHVTVMSVV